MNEFNPYASPKTIEAPPDEPGVNHWRDRDLLVVRRDAAPLARCIFCNAPSRDYVTIKATNVRSIWKPFVFLGFAPGSGRIWGEKSVVYLGICEVHVRHYARKKRMRKIVDAIGVILLCGSLYFRSSHWWVTASVVGLLLVLMFASSVYTKSPLKWKKFDGRFIWVKGASRRFLEDLPEWIPR